MLLKMKLENVAAAFAITLAASWGLYYGKSNEPEGLGSKL
jgi:hypothetical protein